MNADRNVASSQFGPQVQVHQYEGTEGHRGHVTRSEIGLMPAAALAKLHGARGEAPGEHEHYQGAKWDEFKGRIAQGIEHPVFVNSGLGRGAQDVRGQQPPRCCRGTWPPLHSGGDPLLRSRRTAGNGLRAPPARYGAWPVSADRNLPAGQFSWLHETSRKLRPGDFVNDWQPGE